MLGQYREPIARVANPIARLLLGVRVRPNQLTLLGLLCSAAAAWAFAFAWPRTGGLLLAIAGALDVLDGALARAADQASPFGAFLDSVLDRYSDLLVLAGLVVLFMGRDQPWAVGATLAAVVGTIMVSYTRARAESVGVECRVGVMERGERLLILILGALADFLLVAVCIVAVGANLTAVHRIGHVWRATRRALR